MQKSILTQVFTDSPVIPLVVDVQVQLFRRCQSSTVTKPPDWWTVIWTRDTGDGRRGQTKLAHQRGEVNPAGNILLLPSMNWKSHWSPAQLRAEHVSQMGRIGERGDLPVSLVFQLTKNSGAVEIFVLADFTGLQDSFRTISLTSWNVSKRISLLRGGSSWIFVHKLQSFFKFCCLLQWVWCRNDLQTKHWLPLQ